MSRPVNAANVRAAAELCMMVADWLGLDTGPECYPLGANVPPTHNHQTAIGLAARAFDSVAAATGGDYNAETAAEAASWIASGWRFPGDELQFAGPNAPLIVEANGVRAIAFPAPAEVETVEAVAALDDEFYVSDEESTTFEDDGPAEPTEAYTPEVYDFNPEGDTVGDEG